MSVTDHADSAAEVPSLAPDHLLLLSEGVAQWHCLSDSDLVIYWLAARGDEGPANAP